MSKKTDLINCFMDYKKNYEIIQKKADDISKNPAYTDVGRKQAVQELIAVSGPTVQVYHDKAVETINNGLDALAEKWKKSSAGKLTDGGYQAGLANVIKMLEMGAVKEADDIQNIIDTYTGDYNALAVIRGILEHSKDEKVKECVSKVPVDNRERNKQLLTQLRSNVEKHININTINQASRSWNAFNQGLTSVSSSMDSMSQFVTERLSDDLELLN